MLLTWLAIIMAKALEQPIPFYIYIFLILPIIGFFVALFDRENKEEFFVKWLFDTILFPWILIKKIISKSTKKSIKFF
jgi:hypothetical protein